MVWLALKCPKVGLNGKHVCLCIFICIFVCVCVCIIFICIRVYTQTHIYTCIYMYHIRIFIYTQSYMYLCIYWKIPIWMYVYTHLSSYMHVLMDKRTDGVPFTPFLCPPIRELWYAGIPGSNPLACPYIYAFHFIKAQDFK